MGGEELIQHPPLWLYHRISFILGGAVIHYSLPMPHGDEDQLVGVLPMVTSGGPQWTEQRTFALAFSLAT